jgi:hypothetical protein
LRTLRDIPRPALAIRQGIAAQKRNAENLLVIQDKALAQLYAGLASGVRSVI